MEKLIQEKLKEIEKQYDVKILLAVESGSRAWGFASTDSDYDVRFIYVRKKEDYLRLETTRDVIELPINDVLDINGWDLQKTLRLLHASNPTLFEWFSSPIIYIDSTFADEFRKLMMSFYSRKKSLYHYVSMASGNFREYLKTDMVKAKKYFYVLRPVLACKWILEKGTPPPMLFSKLKEEMLPSYLEAEIDKLLDIKMNNPELKEIPRIDILNEYLEKSIEEVKEQVKKLPDELNEWDELDNLFLKTLL